MLDHWPALPAGARAVRDKNIEVATFRPPASPPAEIAAADAARPPEGVPLDEHRRAIPIALLHRDNTFGTPEEDAFRRDFTVNALFYDIASFSIIDYTGGLRDLDARIIRCIGDPEERFQEDPVRMLRAVAMAARLDFSIDPPIDAAIATHRGEIARSAPARLIEEFYKLLRAGAAERAVPHACRTPPARADRPPAAERRQRRNVALARRRSMRTASRFEEPPDTLTNAVLLGSLIVPLGPGGTWRRRRSPGQTRKEPRRRSGMLPLARRDVERLRQILGLQRRLRT